MQGAVVNSRGLSPWFIPGMCFFLGILMFFSSVELFAGGRKDIQTVDMEGKEIWDAEFDIGRLKKGTHNVIIRVSDPAGNTTEDGPYNIRVDPKAALPLARVVYPEDRSVIRSEGLTALGIAAGRFGINRVILKLDSGAVQEVNGTEYWNRPFLADQIAEGSHAISVMAYDGKDTPGPEHMVRFVVDRTPPELNVTSHAQGDLIRGNVTIRGRFFDINTVETLEISSDGGAVFYPLPFTQRKGKSRGQGDFNIRLKTKELADGPLLYIIRATDVTGLSTVKPYLFYIDNNAPKVDIISPRVDEAVWDTIRVTGTLDDAVGVDKFFYEWNGETKDIPIFPGDPYWAVEVDIPYRMYRGNIFKVTAVDKVGNVTVVSRQFRDLRRIRAPTLIIDYPKALTSLGADQPIYGRIAPGYDPATIIIEGVVEELDAMPTFRIPPELIATGRSRLRIWAKAADDSLGEPVLLNTNRPNTPGSAAPRTQIEITSPEQPYHWFSNALKLEGRIVASGASLAGGRLEFRFNPDQPWRPISFNQFDGSFQADLPVEGLAEGGHHLELRTVLGGVEYFPFYYPVNRFLKEPDIQFISPVPALGAVNGRVTVSGVVYSTVPVEEVSYSLNGGRRWERMSILSAYQKYTFSMGVNFSMVREAESQVLIRVTDISGNRYTKPMEVEVDVVADAPVVIISRPLIGQVITGDFQLSGIAFDDDGVDSVFWRVVPRPDPSLPAVARPPREAEWKKIPTNQVFDVDIPMMDLGDGEYFLEVVAEDIYGFRGRTTSRLIRVSTAPPVTRVVSPISTIYNRKVIFIEGTCVDANGIGEILISLDNGLTWQRAEVNGSRWRMSLNTAAYADGVYTILIRTYDKFGVESITNALINIDNTSPDLAVATPKDGDTVGDVLEVTGRAVDNVVINRLSIQVVNLADSSSRLDYKVDPRAVFFESINVRSLPVGDYSMRIIATDLAENETVVSRNFHIVRNNTLAEVAFYNPMPGIDHTGPLMVSGQVTGAFLPKEVSLWVNRVEVTKVPVDNFGLFYYEYPAEGLQQEVTLNFSASFNNPTGGGLIVSHNHEVKVVPYGAILSVDSHADGDSITHRPWLSGRAWFNDEFYEKHEGRLSWNERHYYEVESVDISYDNGRTYQRAVGKENWKFRLETGEMNRGSLAVLIKATFVNGSIATRRLLLVVDVDPPVVKTLQPLENSLHRDVLEVYGIASDDTEIASIQIQLRPGDKFGYSVPKFIQGMYLDGHVLGATFVDGGLGLTFFEDNVKVQFQYGITPDARFEGQVFGMKLIANLLYLPMDYFFGPDWAPFSMSFALGANFSFFTMKEPQKPLILGALLGQWEFIRVSLADTNIRWLKYFSFYVEPIMWFASTDVADAESRIFRVSFGLRLGVL